MKLKSVNPYTEKVMKVFSYEGLSSASKKLKILNNNKEWADKGVDFRASYIKNLASVLTKSKNECAELISKEMGKPIKQSISEIEKCAWLCSYFSENAEEFLKDKYINTDFKKSFVTLQPLGVILGIMPWNFPFWQVFRFAIPAILLGNRIAVKHSSNVPQCALKIEEMMNKALPRNVYKNIFLTGKDTEKVIASDFVSGVSMTGSTHAGSRVAEISGKNIKKTILELGGSDPFIVLDDADLRSCSASACTARFVNSGQSCVAGKRFIVTRNSAERFIDYFVGNVKKLRLGDPLDKNTDIGPLARDDLRTDIDRMVKKSNSMGAKILIGGKKVDGKGFFYEPTVIVNVNKQMPVMSEETFGPVAPVIVVKDETEAVEFANNSNYGLGASVWSRDIDKAESIARKLDAGFVAINEVVRSDPRLPFGGVKKSGYGRELSYISLYEFANIKSIVVSRT